jgi:hypothetical protein
MAEFKLGRIKYGKVIGPLQLYTIKTTLLDKVVIRIYVLKVTLPRRYLQLTKQHIGIKFPTDRIGKVIGLQELIIKLTMLLRTVVTYILPTPDIQQQLQVH